jgi:cytochrome c biogenesis protein CcmG/thiol:disulfide interchange protein DsbE
VSEIEINPTTEIAPADRGRFTWKLAIVVAAVLVALLALFGYGMVLAGRSGGIGINAFGKVGRIPEGPAYDFQAPLFSGGTFQLSQQRGKTVLVNFWASWCVPGQDEATILQSAWLAYCDQGIVFIDVDIWDRDADARAFMRRFGVTYPNGTDLNGRASIEYGITGIPETYVIRPDGTVASHWVGPLTVDDLGSLLREATK